ncbi:MAG TPA: transcriptional repressor [Sphingomicrobium sp.]|jgi:Fur family zinc uptake transcriptional regulator|nr:transcriptional repressor [Sphingomicrobium sp.]
MPHHDHKLHQGPALKAAARDRLTNEGEQWTDMRAAVFDALASFERPASAYDIAEAVSKEQGRRVAANSVYRILDLFVNSNLARRVESANAYVANRHPDCLHDCIFLICDTCGQTVHLDDDSLSGGVRQAAKSAGFSAPRPVIEVRGTCEDCGDS